MRAAALVLFVAACLVPAAPAWANRAYGRLDVVHEQLLTFQLADAGPQVRAASVRMWMYCVQDYGYQYVASFSPAGGDRLLERRPGRYRVRSVRGVGRDRVRFDGTLTVTAVRARYARVHLVLRSVRHRDRTDRCRGELSGTARRAPGVLFAGAADGGEPVLLRRRGPWIDWVAGYGGACRPGGFMEGLHLDFVALTGPATFGWPELIDGYSSLQDAGLFGQAVQLSGTIDGPVATGSFRVVGANGAQPPVTCDTGARRWRAVAS